MIADALATFFPRASSDSRGPLSNFWYGPVPVESSAGIDVQPESAMRVATVFACVRKLAETLGSLPWRVYKYADARTREQDPSHEMWRVLHDQPNRWQTAMEWREMGMAHLLLRGNFLCLKEYTRDEGEELIPLSPEPGRMEIKQLPSRELQYTYRFPDGTKQTFGSERIFHVRGLTLNGIIGISVLEYARNAIGLAIAQETHGAALFKNGSMPAFWIKRPRESGKWTKEHRENFRGGWRGIHAGADNAHNPPILEDGMTLESLGLTNEDSQWIESRGFQAVEIARFFGVPPHLVGILDRATFSNIEQQSIEFVVHTMRPWAVRWEQTAKRDLIPEDDHYSKIILDGLERGDKKSRYEGYNVGIQGGWLLPNEARELEDMNPIEGGDEPRFPLNMQPAGGAPDKQQQQGDQRQQASDKQAAFQTLLDDVAGRIASREANALSSRVGKASSDAAHWDQWVSEFFRAHQDYVCRAVIPIALGWIRLGGVVSEYDSLGESLCNDALSAIRGDDPVSVVKDWQNTRATALASELRRRFGMENEA